MEFRLGSIFLGEEILFTTNPTIDTIHKRSLEKALIPNKYATHCAQAENISMIAIHIMLFIHTYPETLGFSPGSIVAKPRRKKIAIKEDLLQFIPYK